MLDQDIRDIRENLRMGHYRDESDVSQGIVLRLLATLGWPIYDTQVVCPEYALEGGRVDFAFCHPANKPRIFIEVKRVGKGAGAERQLFEYASHMFHMGVQLAILTDGREWSFFLPARAGSYDERRICKLNLVEHDVAKSAQRLERYLRYEAVRSQEAFVAAQEDYRDILRERDIQEALPKAWVKLVAEEDATLLKVVAECVEELCGHRPVSDTVARFLKATVQPHWGPLPPPARTPASPTPRTAPNDQVPAKEPVVKSRQKVAPTPTTPTVSEKEAEGTPDGVGFTLFGEFAACRSGRAVLINVIEALAERDSSFIESFVALPQHGRTRRYIARDRSELYPGSPHLAKEAHQLSSGYWLGVNVNQEDIQRIIKLACEVAGIGYGTDLTITLR